MSVDRPELKLLGLFCPELYDFKLRLITRLPKTGIFVKCYIFEGQLPQKHTEREGFDARTLQREILCA